MGWCCSRLATDPVSCPCPQPSIPRVGQGIYCAAILPLTAFVPWPARAAPWSPNARDFAALPSMAFSRAACCRAATLVAGLAGGFCLASVVARSTTLDAELHSPSAHAASCPGAFTRPILPPSLMKALEHGQRAQPPVSSIQRLPPVHPICGAAF
ncbi:hypothetical protein IQ07DRAFT_213963 [Pyrenochaeta sp. DS3sAY3a]|nr:hypothetical protein IQ07DRAFT_213963 [Pyrenochaeta sp. DS3sAY3a]